MNNLKFATVMGDAARYPLRDPLRLLALGVLLRWFEDVRDDLPLDTELGAEWIELAEVDPSRLYREVIGATARAA